MVIATSDDGGWTSLPPPPPLSSTALAPRHMPHENRRLPLWRSSLAGLAWSCSCHAMPYPIQSPHVHGIQP